MNGMLNIVMVIATIIVAVMTYQVKFKARTLELDIHVLHKNSQSLKNDISILRAEKAYLSRPERIERLAQKFLALSPTVPTRAVSYDTLRAQRLEVEAERSASLALQAMKQKDKERSATQEGARKSASNQADKIRMILEREDAQNKVSNNAAQQGNRHKAQVMGSIQRKAAQPAQNNIPDDGAAALEASIAEDTQKTVQPTKPKWTYYGGIGDDD